MDRGGMICHREGEYVPTTGMLFTAYALENPGRDPRIEGIFPRYTCYVKSRSLFYQGDLALETPFRFLVVAGPFELRHHQYAHVTPFRPLVFNEPDALCILTGLEFNLLKAIAQGRGAEIPMENLTIWEDLQYLRRLHKNGVRF